MTTNDIKQIGEIIDKKLNDKLEKQTEHLIKEIKLAIEESEAHIIEVVDKTKADKKDVDILKVKVSKLEQAVFS